MTVAQAKSHMFEPVSSHSHIDHDAWFHDAWLSLHGGSLQHGLVADDTAVTKYCC